MGRMSRKSAEKRVNGHANGSGQEMVPITAWSREEIIPNIVNVDPDVDPGPDARIRLQFLVGPVNPTTYARAIIGSLEPATAVQIGEYLVKEGQRLSSSLHVPTALEIPADLRG